VKKISAGVLLYRTVPELQVMLVHPGGPLWAGKEDGCWSIPKGEIEPGEAAEVAALRELREETGWSPEGALIALGSVTQKSGKVVHAWAAPSSADPTTLVSGTFRMEWPRGSGMEQSFPEVDRARWFDLVSAARKMNPGQVPLLERLRAHVQPG
jgi:predicted NUDIX family NTP pyrophosphohydrolase